MPPRRTSDPRDFSPSGFRRNRRSWTNNGVHYTIETATYTSPSFSFGTMGGTANSLFNAFAASHGRTQRHPTGSIGLLGTAVGLIDNFLSSNHSSRDPFNQRRHAPRRPPVHHVEEDSDGEKHVVDLDDYPGVDRNNRRSVVGRFKDKIQDRKSSDRHSSSPSRRRETIPDARPRSSSQIPLKRDEPRQSSRTQREPTIEAPNLHNEAPRSRTTVHTDIGIIEALENAVEHHRREIRRFKKELERATRQPHTTTAYLQSLLNELKNNETALDDAVRGLQRARSGQIPREPSTSTRAPRRESARVPDDVFPPDPTFMPGNRASHPLFNDAFDMHGLHPFAQSFFGHFHSHFDRHHGQFPFEGHFTDYFEVPTPNTNEQRKRARNSIPNPNAYQAYTRTPSFRATAVPPNPPATLLTPTEARRLFQLYNQKWNELASTDPNIPFPTRGLHSATLLGRDTLWAPNLNAHPSTWSEEAVMQANAQAFYLGVVGLKPKYSEVPATGRIEIGFDKDVASSAQIKELIDMLKKEKMRWHSDRLGRRNNGNPGSNEALQRDDKARAVFHAACELMEAAQ